MLCYFQGGRRSQQETHVFQWCFSFVLKRVNVRALGPIIHNDNEQVFLHTIIVFNCQTFELWCKLWQCSTYGNICFIIGSNHHENLSVPPPPNATPSQEIRLIYLFIYLFIYYFIYLFLLFAAWVSPGRFALQSAKPRQLPACTSGIRLIFWDY